MLEPAEPGRGWTVVGVGLLAVAAMLAAGRLDGRRRQLAAVAAIVPLLALALLAGRVPDELLLPGGWSELAGGISRGISDLPGVRVPYRGLDEWVRTVIPLGGSALVLAAALLAFWPRRDAARLPGRRAAAADRALRRAGRRAGLHRRVHARRRLHAADGRVPAAGEAAPAGRGRGRGALARASPRSSRSSPRRCSTATRRGSTTRPGRWRPRRRSRRRSRWDHSYGGLNWPRDGRELLRVRAHRPAYWKAENLDDFDGEAGGARRSASPCPSARDDPGIVKRWTQTIKVSIRNLRTDQFITAGYASDVDIPRLNDIPTLDGLFSPRARCAAATPTPRGSTRRGRRRTSAAAQGTDYDGHPGAYTTIFIARPALPGAPHVRMTFPFFGDEAGRSPMGPPRQLPAERGPRARRA